MVIFSISIILSKMQVLKENVAEDGIYSCGVMCTLCAMYSEFLVCRLWGNRLQTTGDQRLVRGLAIASIQLERTRLVVGNRHFQRRSNTTLVDLDA